MGTLDGEDMMRCGEVAAAVKRAVPHSCVVYKNLEGHLGNEQSQPQARLHSPVPQK